MSSRSRKYLPTLFEMLGLHPLVGFGMFAVDWMLFGPEVVTGGLALPITTAIAFILTVPCILIQRYSYGDNWGASIGKGMMVGLLVAIPTPLFSFVSALGGWIGWKRMKSGI